LSSNKFPDIVILAGARTPMAEWVGGKRGDGQNGGALAAVSALDLGAVAARGALERSGVPATEIDHVVMGNALQTSGDALYGARHVALKAGVPETCPALTVNRLCGSGLQSVATAAQLLQLGEANWVIAGGMESMSQAPHVLRGARGGLRLGPGSMLEDSLFVALKDTYCGFYMAQTSDNLARKYGITRAEQDEFALQSQRKAGAAIAAGRFRDEIVPVKVPSRKGEVVVDADEHARPDTTPESLAKLPAVFDKKNGTVTAGNASGITDGAAALLLMRAGEARKRGLEVLATLGPATQAGVDPRIMGIGPVPAMQALERKAGLKADDFDLIELNEAFAAQVLACHRQLPLPMERVNANGGSIALGHPIGATGARIVATLLHELKRRGGRRGLATLCISGGMGLAVSFERK